MVTIIMMNDDDFERDDDKAAANLRDQALGRPGVPLMTCSSLSNRISATTTAKTASAIGMIDGRLVTVVFTERGERTRIISARKATADDRRAYYQSQTP